MSKHDEQDARRSQGERDRGRESFGEGGKIGRKAREVQERVQERLREEQGREERSRSEAIDEMRDGCSALLCMFGYRTFYWIPLRRSFFNHRYSIPTQDKAPDLVPPARAVRSETTQG